jgi:hypothetical protein
VLGLRTAASGAEVMLLDVEAASLVGSIVAGILGVSVEGAAGEVGNGGVRVIRDGKTTLAGSDLVVARACVTGILVRASLESGAGVMSSSGGLGEVSPGYLEMAAEVAGRHGLGDGTSLGHGLASVVDQVGGHDDEDSFNHCGVGEDRDGAAFLDRLELGSGSLEAVEEVGGFLSVLGLAAHPVDLGILENGLRLEFLIHGVEEGLVGHDPRSGIAEGSDVPAFCGGLGDGVFKGGEDTEKCASEFGGGRGVFRLEELEQGRAVAGVFGGGLEFRDVRGFEEAAGRSTSGGRDFDRRRAFVAHEVLNLADGGVPVLCRVIEHSAEFRDVVAAELGEGVHELDRGGGDIDVRRAEVKVDLVPEGLAVLCRDCSLEHP